MDQIKTLIKDLTMVQRTSVVAAVLISGAAIAALLHYRTESDFRPLYTAMAPEDAAPVVQKLRESGVEYRLADNGGTVLVPSAHLADSRLTLASAGLPKSGRIGFELFDKTNFGATDLVEHINYQRALEGELERSVMSIADVEQARVHLTFPKESVFLDQQQPAKASVMVKLHPGAHLSATNVLALSNLAASAVEGLSPDAVAVIDMDGNLLSRPKRSTANAGADAQVTSESLEVRQQLERDLVAKINATLEPLLGPEQFRAGASVDCDLTSGEQEEETFNPDQSVMVTSQKSEDVNDRGSAVGGVPGTQANLQKPQTAGMGSAGGTTHHTENVTYQSSRVVRHTRIPQGVVRKMSLSVLVGQPAHWEGTGKNRHQVFVPPSADTLKTIHDLVAGVTGLDASRGDQLIVETLPFEQSLAVEAQQMLGNSPDKKEAQPKWLEMVNKYRNLVVIAVAGLVLLAVLLTVVLRYMPKGNAKSGGSLPVPQLTDGSPGANAMSNQAALAYGAPTADSRHLLAEAQGETTDRIRNLAQRDASASANVLRMWLHQKKA